MVGVLVGLTLGTLLGIDVGSLDGIVVGIELGNADGEVQLFRKIVPIIILVPKY